MMAAACIPTARLGLPSQPSYAARRAGKAGLPGPRPVLPQQQRRKAAVIVAFKEGEEREVDVSRDTQRDVASSGFELGPGFETSPLNPAFTRRREHLVGRVAMLGFAGTIIGELLTGLGPVSQLSGETGLSPGLIYSLLLGLAGWNIFMGLAPGSPTWSRANQQDAAVRRVPRPLAEPRRALVKGELVVGRIAMLGFFGALVMEYMWRGESPLAHLGLITPGSSLTQAPWWVLGTVTTFVLGGCGFFSVFADMRRDNDML